MATSSGRSAWSNREPYLLVSDPLVSDEGDARVTSIGVSVVGDVPALGPQVSFGGQGMADGGRRLTFRRHYLGGLSDPDVDLALQWASGTSFSPPPGRAATIALPVATLLASATGVDLVVDAPVDAQALDGARRASRLLARWFGWYEASITAPEQVDSSAEFPGALAPSNSTALFWSRGLDSTATLLALGMQQRSPRMLVAVDWVDPPLAGPDQQAIMESTAAACMDIAFPLVRVSTNARQFTDPVMSWDYSYGTVLAACALQLEGLCRTVGIASTFPEGEDHPHGSHPDLDPLWSSSLLEIAHLRTVPGGRLDKAALAATDPTLLAWLKVCWEAPGDGNCGRCTKCLLTMTALYLVGAGSAVAEVFGSALSPEAVDAVTPRATVVPLIAEVLDELSDAEDPVPFVVDLARAWRQSLGRIVPET